MRWKNAVYNTPSVAVKSDNYSVVHLFAVKPWAFWHSIHIRQYLGFWINPFGIQTFPIGTQGLHNYWTAIKHTQTMLHDGYTHSHLLFLLIGGPEKGLLLWQNCLVV